MKKIKLSNMLIVLILSLGAIIMVGPLLWMISTSLKDKAGVFQLPPQWIPNPVRFDAYKRLSELDTLFSGIKNTVIVSLSVTIIGTLTSSLAAFSFAKLRMPFKDVLFLLLLAALMIPYPAVMIPQFMMFSKIGWVDTLLPLIIPGIFGNITMIFFLRQYLSNIPDSIVEAAKIDGAGYLQTFFQLIFPLIRPAIAAQFILWFMGAWNDYLAPLIYLNSPEKQTLQVVIANLNAAYAIQTDYPLIMAASVVSLLPVLVVFIIFQKQIIESVALSGMKG
ncbi:carbohydrate ABC transporter permease [Enterococcus gallinarum]|uniref:carbohydrate ABC transporter permease n=1 Tax=Enterococcus gallinarum TaxID=1353 RepID=UPI0014730026|nr:carbohydrate ABC transporter permease [Enterococcus gallinarum]MCI5685479.1 carbohydrate ABC transporter permease [Enterococcus gallinarum]MDV7821875.1 carbohydrate ABC transporter permease [Enterococcus gallinarum]MDV7872923.1 carbohydrate ABC transporter permease [Enterococcus gallinarum]MDY4070764.1 carbohydrate ABC transporter permease [Enterococcus gallinarum]NME47660.1 carbohydrate ABC transporter permease [Enterococcus gallinarum]